MFLPTSRGLTSAGQHAVTSLVGVVTPGSGGETDLKPSTGDGSEALLFHPAVVSLLDKSHFTSCIFLDSIIITS